MEYKIKLRNPITKERTTLTAYNKEMAMNMINQSLKDGWRIKLTHEISGLVKGLQKNKEREELIKCY